MQIRTAVTTAEIQEAIRLSRPRNFWPKFFLGNWYASLIAIAVIGGDFTALFNHRTMRVGPSLGLLALVAALMGYSWYVWNRKAANSIKAAHGRIESLSLDSDGVRMKLTSGASTFVPWSGYSKWTEGSSIFLLANKDGSTILPAEEGSREAIRGLLASQIA